MQRNGGTGVGFGFDTLLTGGISRNISFGGHVHNFHRIPRHCSGLRHDLLTVRVALDRAASHLRSEWMYAMHPMLNHFGASVYQLFEG